MVWNKIFIYSGIAITLIVLLACLFRCSKREKQALAGIDHFLGGQDGGLCEEGKPAITEEPRSLKWRHSDIDEFCRDYVTPFVEILEKVGAFEGVLKLLDMLDKAGDCPSVAMRYRDSKSQTAVPDMESAGWQAHHRKSYDVLKRHVSLREHTLNVATILIEKRKRESKDFYMEMGRLLFVGLGHDIGKIPTGGKPYLKKDHFIISHEILNALLPMEYPSRSEILTAVRDHHFPNSSGNLLISLKAADHEARQKELKKYGALQKCELPFLECKNTGDFQKKWRSNFPGYEPVDLSWLDVPQLLERICDRINIVEKGRYEAFSHAGIVYVYPRLIAQYTCDLAVIAGRSDITAYLGNYERMGHLEFAVRKALSEYVPDMLVGEEYIGRRFRIVKKDGKRLNPGFYLPLKISAFGLVPAADIERRKQRSTILQSIYNVSICNPETQHRRKIL